MFYHTEMMSSGEASQSSDAGGRTAERAIDDITSTHIDDGGCSHTQSNNHS